MIFFLYGADSFRRRQKLNELKERFMAAVDTFGQSLIILDGSQSTPQELQEKISSGSLFTKKRMIILEGIFNNKNSAVFELLLLLGSKNIGSEDSAIVFNEAEIITGKLKAEAKKLYNFLLKQPYVQEFAPLNNAQTLDFAQKEINKLNGKITGSALSLLVARTGNDLWRLSNEIKKITASSQEKIINDDLIQNLVKGEIEDNIFALTDALGSKNNLLALKLLEEQFAAGLSAEYILAMFQRQLKIMLEIKIIQSQEKLSEAQLAAKLKIHPFVIKKGLNQSAKFSLNELKAIFNRLLTLDYLNKKGRTDLQHELCLLTQNFLN